MEETAVRADHQRDAMHPAQQAQVIDKEIDGMDVDQVITADGPQCGRRHRVAAGTPVTHTTNRNAGFQGLLRRHGTARKEQTQSGHLDHVPTVLQGDAQTFDDTLHPPPGRKKLPCELQNPHNECTRAYSAGRRAIQSRKRRRRRRGSSQMARKMA